MKTETIKTINEVINLMKHGVTKLTLGINKDNYKIIKCDANVLQVAVPEKYISEKDNIDEVIYTLSWKKNSNEIENGWKVYIDESVINHLNGHVPESLIDEMKKSISGIENENPVIYKLEGYDNETGKKFLENAIFHDILGSEVWFKKLNENNHIISSIEDIVAKKDIITEAVIEEEKEEKNETSTSKENINLDDFKKYVLKLIIDDLSKTSEGDGEEEIPCCCCGCRGCEEEIEDEEEEINEEDNTSDPSEDMFLKMISDLLEYGKYGED